EAVRSRTGSRSSESGCSRHEDQARLSCSPSVAFSIGPVDQLSCAIFTAGLRKGGSDKCGGISMDSLITAAARALAAGDPLGALKRVALRDDAPGLALRGIAMAQLGDFVRAKELLRAAARTVRAREGGARARCVVAEAEVALASRDLGWPAKTLSAARVTLEQHGDLLNAA